MIFDSCLPPTGRQDWDIFYSLRITLLIVGCWRHSMPCVHAHTSDCFECAPSRQYKHHCVIHFQGLTWNGRGRKQRVLCWYIAASASFHSVLVFLLLGRKQAIYNRNGAKDKLNNPSIFHRHSTKTKQSRRHNSRSDRRSQ